MPGPAYRWLYVDGRRGIPVTAVRGGTDIDGDEIYVGRALHEGDMLPAKVIPNKAIAYVCWGGGEHKKDSYEVLCQGEFTWEHGSNGSVPEDAILAGHTTEGEPLYVGRVFHDGSLTIGKVHQNHGCLYIPFNNEEISFREYEVLVLH